MAVDTTLFMADIPAGTYAAGDKVVLNVKSGPAVVRDGYGQPILKDVCSGVLVRSYSGEKIQMRFYIQNQNWNDPIINGPSAIDNDFAFNDDARGLNKGSDCPLQVNSGWTVVGEFLVGITTTVAQSVFCTIDIDYPSVGAVKDPMQETGVPASIVYDFDNYNTITNGTSSTATWSVINVDKFKAGARYLMSKMSLAVYNSSGGGVGFIAISGGASMAGLRRIIPINTNTTSVGKRVNYTTVETKGPVNFELMFFSASTVQLTGVTMQATVDYVKRG